MSVGMTSIYDASGKVVPCTVLEAGPCVVTQVKTVEKDGYSAIQLAYDEKKEKNTTKSLKGHFAKAGTTPKKIMREFTRFEEGHRKSLGEVLDVTVFEEGEFVDVSGTSKGKGFQGVVKRHHFRGVGDAVTRVQRHAHGRPDGQRQSEGHQPPDRQDREREEFIIS